MLQESIHSFFLTFRGDTWFCLPCLDFFFGFCWYKPSVVTLGSVFHVWISSFGFCWYKPSVVTLGSVYNVWISSFDFCWYKPFVVTLGSVFHVWISSFGFCWYKPFVVTLGSVFHVWISSFGFCWYKPSVVTLGSVFHVWISSFGFCWYNQNTRKVKKNARFTETIQTCRFFRQTPSSPEKQVYQRFVHGLNCLIKMRLLLNLYCFDLFSEHQQLALF